MAQNKHAYFRPLSQSFAKFTLARPKKITHVKAL